MEWQGASAVERAFFTQILAKVDQGHWVAARRLAEQALLVKALRQQARLLLWEICQAQGDTAAGISYLRAAVRETPLIVRPSTKPERRVLAIAVVGDFQANLPLTCLLDPARTTLYTLWMAEPEAVLADPYGTLPHEIPPFDCTFIAIAEDARHKAALAAADAWAAALGAPVINNGARIAALSREGAAKLLADIPDTIVPEQRIYARKALANAQELPFPLVIRPEGAHAGCGLARIAEPAELQAYLTANKAERFYVAPFVNYQSPDGLWRKYRFVFVEGVPFPYHLAIHSDWAIWYYNARMQDDPAKRAEEARFLADFSSVFPPRAQRALGVIASRVGLSYFGLDCALMPNGRVLIFEVETGMIVHDRDPVEIYPYKGPAVSRIFRAVEAMIDRRIASSRHDPTKSGKAHNARFPAPGVTSPVPFPGRSSAYG